MIRVLGIDPGIAGACAVYCVGATVPTAPNGIIDMPVCGEGPLKRVDYVALRDWIFEMKPTHAIIERVWSQPLIVPGRGKRGKEGDKAEGFGGKQNFVLGGAYHAACAVVWCLGYEAELVPKSTWSGLYAPRLDRRDKDQNMKEEARLLAIDLDPAIEPFLERKKDHNRAEAWLIARYHGAILTGNIERPGRGGAGGGKGASRGRNRKRGAG